ncbi:MAG: gliding motility-associated C-terminal domain-containing protein [Bacteroidota bacterium]
MAIRILFLCILASIGVNSLSAQAIEQDCLGAIPVCSETIHIDSISTDYGNVSENDGSCLGVERNSTWFRVRTSGAGTLCFVIIPDNAADNFDWAVYDVSRHHCSELKTRPQLLISCNASPEIACNGETGPNGEGSCASQQAECIAASGQSEYVIRVQAPQGARAGFEINFGNSTAELIRPSDDPIVRMDPLCYGEAAYLQANPIEGGNVNWYADPNDEKPIFTGINYNAFPLTKPRTYYLETQNSLNCRDHWYALTLNPLEKVQSKIIASDSVLEFPSPVVNLSLGGNIQPAYTYWQLGDGQKTPSFNPVYAYEYPGNYDVKVSVKDIYGCKFEYEKQIFVRPIAEIYVPSAFTPNNDGSNDFWQVFATLTQQFEVVIFDRNGKEIFRANQADFKWDGLDQQGKSVPVGTYPYRISYIDFTGNLKQRGGAITLFR